MYIYIYIYTCTYMYMYACICVVPVYFFVRSLKRGACEAHGLRRPGKGKGGGKAPLVIDVETLAERQRCYDRGPNDHTYIRILMW